MLFLDLDGFKQVNDRHGHDEGDELLRQFAQRIVDTVRKTDTVGRLAGDEFVVILEMLQGDAGAQEIADKLLPVLQQPFVLKTAIVAARRQHRHRAAPAGRPGQHRAADRPRRPRHVRRQAQHKQHSAAAL